MIYGDKKKVTISTTITQKEFLICKEKHLKYNYVFTQGLLSLANTQSLASRLQDAEETNANLLKKLESLLSRLRALEEAQARRD